MTGEGDGTLGFINEAVVEVDGSLMTVEPKRPCSSSAGAAEPGFGRSVIFQKDWHRLR